MRNDRISSGFSVKILSNDVIHHIQLFYMVIKNITNLHKLCKYAYMHFLFFISLFLFLCILLFLLGFLIFFLEEFISEVYEIN